MHLLGRVGVQSFIGTKNQDQFRKRIRETRNSMFKGEKAKGLWESAKRTYREILRKGGWADRDPKTGQFRARERAYGAGEGYGFPGYQGPKGGRGGAPPPSPDG